MSPVTEHISDAYQLGAIHSIEETVSISGQKSAVIRASLGAFFMKEYEEHNSLRVPYISVIERYFYERDVPAVLSIPVVQKTADTERVDQDDYAVRIGTTTYVLYPYLEHPGIVHRDALTTQHTEGFASMHARMHLVGEAFLKEYLPSENDKDSEEHTDMLYKERILNVLYQTTEEARLDSMTSLETLQKISEHIVEHSPLDLKMMEIVGIKKGMINAYLVTQNANRSQVPELSILPNTALLHGDMHEQNVFFDTRGNVTHIFDFDNFTLGSPEYELVQSILHVCFGDARFDEREFSLAQTYISVYAKVRPINIECLRIALEHSIFKKFHSTTFEEDHYLKQMRSTDVYIEEAYRAMKYFEVHTERFINAIINMCTLEKGE